MGVLPESVSVYHLSAWFQGGIDSLEVELQTGMNCHVGAESWTSRQCS